MSFAASQSFPLEELARNQAASFRHQRSVLSFSRPLARIAVPIVGAIAVRFVLHYAQRFAQQAVWFRGAAGGIEREPLDREIDPQDALRALLDQMEHDLLTISQGAGKIASDIRKRDGKARGGLRDALDRLSRVALELREEVRSFKAGVQAHDANVDAMRRAVRRVAANHADLQADLERAIH
jgi:hypothetical protein